MEEPNLDQDDEIEMEDTNEVDVNGEVFLAIVIFGMMDLAKDQRTKNKDV